MIALERVIGHTMFSKTVKKVPVPVSLSEKAGVPADEVAVRRWMMVLSNQRNNLLEAKSQRDAKKEAERAEKAAFKNNKKRTQGDDNYELVI
jgi:hypothetical protein